MPASVGVTTAGAGGNNFHQYVLFGICTIVRIALGHLFIGVVGLGYKYGTQDLTGHFCFLEMSSSATQA